MKRLQWSTLFFLLVLTVAAQQTNQVHFREQSFDFGKVEEDGGPVTHEFVFTNNSPRPVKIMNVQASCGCTTPGWSKEPVEPGKTGFVQAAYNPKGRPGFFNKSLTVTTDLEASPIILHIKGQVSTDAGPTENEFPIVNGALRFKGSSFNMGKVFLKDEYVVKEFPVFNSGKNTVHFLGKYVAPKHIKVDVEPKALGAGQQGTVRVSYNGKLRGQYGFQSDNIEIQTDDGVNPAKSFSVYATLEDYFPALSAEEMARAPKLKLAAYELDFGKIKGASTREISFTNTGKKELHVHALQPNCTCITAAAEKTVIKPGDAGTLSIAFDPQDRKGTQQKAVTIYSNDPRNPVQRLIFTAYVE